MTRDDYIMRRSVILNQERPYTSTVKQRGTFYNTKTTFGTDREFKEVILIFMIYYYCRNIFQGSNLRPMVHSKWLILPTRASIRRLDRTGPTLRTRRWTQ